MSLTQSDLQEIRNIVDEAVRSLQSEIQALRNDIEEIYDMLRELKKSSKRIISIEEFEKLSTEEKLLTINSELLIAAKEAGITLPRS